MLVNLNTFKTINLAVSAFGKANQKIFLCEKNREKR